MTTEKQSSTTDKQETETTETKSKPFPKKALGMSLASVAVAAALGFGVAYANGVFTPKAAPTPPAMASQEATKENKIELSQEAVAEATSELSYGGKDVSVTNPVSVSIKDGHVMVVETVNDSAANNVWYAPRRAAALAARIAETISSQARKIALQVAEAFGSIGLLAVELFLTKGGEIWVNEVAPRPHNSGHYSIEASYTSQFEQHLRAILDLPLGNTESKVAGVMVNLVGAEGYAGDVIYEHIEDVLSLPGVTPHIYGKRQTRPFRKMGHITITHPDIEQARSLAQKVKKTIKVISRQ